MNKYVDFCPPAPLKGGTFAFFKEILFICEYEPPFRGVGGQKKREYNPFRGGLMWGNQIGLVLLYILRNPVPNL